MSIFSLRERYLAAGRCGLTNFITARIELSRRIPSLAIATIPIADNSNKNFWKLDRLRFFSHL